MDGGAFFCAPMKRPLCLLALSIASSLAGCGRPQASTKPSVPPAFEGADIVIFLVDTLRADRTGPGGDLNALTPTMNMLAEEGVVFEAAHSPGPWTLPSVVSILTGRHVAEHNVVQEKFELSERIPILPQLLRDGGYQTVSYHRNPFAGASFGMDRGFQICEQVKKRSIDGKNLAGMYDKLNDDPYFLYIHNVEPHDPQATHRPARKRIDWVDPQFLERYTELIKDYRLLTRKDFELKRPLGSTDNTAEQASVMSELTTMVDQVENIYAGAVAMADDRMASVIEMIKLRGRWENTIFILISDHGEEFSDHEGWLHDQSVYQKLLHVPMIIRFPDAKWAGTRISDPVSLVDLVPTVLDATGPSWTGVRLSGESLLPLIRGDETRAGRPFLVGMRDNRRKYYEPYKRERGDVNLAIRQDDWKAIVNVEVQTLELYDLSTDPGEQTDLSAERHVLANELAAFGARSYQKLIENSERAEGGGLGRGDADTLEGLKDMGYIGGDDD